MTETNDKASADRALAPAFPAATREQWRALVEKALKRADADKALVTRTYDDIAIEPLYKKAQGDLPRALRGAAGPWRIVQRVDHPQPREANALALADLNGGADGLVLVLNGAPTGRGFGIKLPRAEDFDRALDGVMLDLVFLRLELPAFGGPGIVEQLARWAERAKVVPQGLSVDLGLDPVGDLARTGAAPAPLDALMAESARAARSLGALSAWGKAFMADGRAVHEAGGSEAQELAFVLAAAVEYLRLMERHGDSLDAARGAISFLLVADASELLTIAKFRAMRCLWARAEEACGLAPKPIGLHAETAWRMTTRRDPFVNMLRATVAAFSAGVGGADSVTVLPFTSALGLPDQFARRVARNTQLILIEEANLWRVADPAAGSGALEALTERLAERAWSSFQAIEKAGGIVECLKGGIVQGHVAMARAARQKAIAFRRDAITGTSDFPHLAEAPVAVLMDARDGSGARNELPEGLHVEALPSQRDAEPFEELRDRADAILKARGARPRIFLANLGPVAAFNQRATFAKNLFEAGGIETLGNDGFADLQAMRQAFHASGASLACLCSSDEIYEKQATDAALALQYAGATAIYLAGRPQKLHESRPGTPPIRYIFAGCDAVSTLTEALEAV